MFSKETYISRRAELKRRVGSGLILFLGNDEVGMNYAANIYPFRQDSSFLYYFGLAYAGLRRRRLTARASVSLMPLPSLPMSRMPEDGRAAV